MPTLPPSRLPLVLSLVAVGLGLTRFVDLGRQSLWQDELCNRDYARWLGAEGLPEHPVTYAAIRLSMAIGGESAFWVRLPSALAMSVAILVVVLWAWRRLGPMTAAIFGAVAVLNPMAIRFAQDGGHYGLLFAGGAAAGMAAAEAFRAAKWSWVRVLFVMGCAIWAVVVVRAHHFQAAAVAAALGTAGLALGHGLAQREWGGPRRPALVWGSAATLVIVSAIPLILFALPRIRGFNFAAVPHAPKSLFLNDAFPLTLANFFGAWLSEGALDFVAGLTGLAAVIAGGILAFRSGGAARGVAVFTALALLLPFCFFAVFPGFLLLFNTRYLIFALPFVLLLWSCLAARAGECLCARTPLKWPVMLAGVSTLLGIQRLAVFLPLYYGGHFLPLQPAMEDIAARLPADAIIGTRQPFMAQAYEALDFPDDTFPQQYRWFGDIRPTARNASSQALFLAARNPGAVFTLDYERPDNWQWRDYERFSRQVSELDSIFPSYRTPIGDSVHGLVLRSVPDLDGFGQLPILGADAIRVFPTESVSYFPTRKPGDPTPPNLGLMSGAGASFFLRPTSSDVAIRLMINARVPREWWVFGWIEETSTPLAWYLGPEGPATVALRVPVSALSPDPQGTVLHVWFPRVGPGDTRLQPATWIEVQSIMDIESVDVPLLEPRELTPLADPWGGDKPYDWTVVAPEPGARKSFLSASSKAPLPAGPLLVVYPLETTGLGLCRVQVVASWSHEGKPYQIELLRGRDTASSIGPVWPAMVLLGDGDAPLSFSLDTHPWWSQGPSRGELRFQTPVVYSLAP